MNCLFMPNCSFTKKYFDSVDTECKPVLWKNVHSEKRNPLAQWMIYLTDTATISVNQLLLLYLKYRIWCDDILVT